MKFYSKKQNTRVRGVKKLTNILEMGLEMKREKNHLGPGYRCGRPAIDRCDCARQRHCTGNLDQ